MTPNVRLSQPRHDPTSELSPPVEDVVHPLIDERLDSVADADHILKTEPVLTEEPIVMWLIKRSCELFAVSSIRRAPHIHPMHGAHVAKHFGLTSARRRARYVHEKHQFRNGFDGGKDFLDLRSGRAINILGWRLTDEETANELDFRFAPLVCRLVVTTPGSE